MGEEWVEIKKSRGVQGKEGEDNFSLTSMSTNSVSSWE